MLCERNESALPRRTERSRSQSAKSRRVPGRDEAPELAQVDRWKGRRYMSVNPGARGPFEVKNVAGKSGRMYTARPRD